MFTDKQKIDLSLGYDAGNYANAYEAEDYESAMDSLPEDASDEYRYGFVLGFFGTYEAHEMPCAGLDDYEEAYEQTWQLCQEVGIGVEPRELDCGPDGDAAYDAWKVGDR